MNRILIAEDEPLIAAFLEKCLRANGFTTAVARDGHEAALMACSDDFDLLLLDIGLPCKDGWMVLSELRTRGEQLPIIILTAIFPDFSQNLKKEGSKTAKIYIP